jgi:hypothetical protein
MTGARIIANFVGHAEVSAGLREILINLAVPCCVIARADKRSELRRFSRRKLIDRSFNSARLIVQK